MDPNDINLADPGRLEYMRRLASMTLPERNQNDRETIHQEYASSMQALEPHLTKFLDKHNNNTSVEDTPLLAVDIGSGRAVGTVHLALTLSSLHDGRDFLFYPTDYAAANVPPKQQLYADGYTQAQQSLQHHIEEDKETSTELGWDSEIEPLFKGDLIELGGLRSDQFNGRRGFVQGPDPDDAGRLAVQLSADPKDRKSFKKENVTFVGAQSASDARLRQLKLQKKSHAFYAGLLDRVREIDILHKETWSNVQDIYGKCTLVTCMSFLSCLGYRDPTAWHDTLQLASKLLQVDGYILQYDESGHAGFGDSKAMASFAEDQGLGLVLEENTICPVNPNYVIVIWRKV